MDSLLEIIAERGSQKIYKPTDAIEEVEVSIIFLVIIFFCW